MNLGPGFGTWIWELDLGLDLGLTIKSGEFFLFRGATPFPTYPFYNVNISTINFPPGKGVLRVRGNSSLFIVVYFLNLPFHSML